MELCFSYTFLYLREDQDDKYLCSDEANTHSVQITYAQEFR